MNMRRRFAVETARQSVRRAARSTPAARSSAPKSARLVLPRDRARASRRPPKRFVGDVGPVGIAGAAQEQHAVAPLPAALLHGRRADAEPEHAGGQRGGARLVGGSGQILFGERQRARAGAGGARAARRRRDRRPPLRSSRSRRRRPPRPPPASAARRCRMRAAAARPTISPIGEIGRAAERVVRLDGAGAAIGHQELAALAARLGDALGKGVGEQRADVAAARLSARRPMLAPAAPALCARRRASSARGERSREAVEPLPRSTRVAAEPAFGQHDRDAAGEIACALRRGGPACAPDAAAAAVARSPRLLR